MYPQNELFDGKWGDHYRAFPLYSSSLHYYILKFIIFCFTYFTSMLTHHKAFLFHTHIMIQFCCMQARRELMITHVQNEI